jgi:hypothetical protein
MKSFKTLNVGDKAWVLYDDLCANMHVNELTLVSRENRYDGFCGRIYTLVFHDDRKNVITVDYDEYGSEGERSWAYTRGGTIELEKDVVIRRLEKTIDELNDELKKLKGDLK